MTIKVNGEVVSSQAVLRELARLVRFYGEHLPGEELADEREAIVRKAKDQAIGAKLLLDEAVRLGMFATDQEVVSQYRRMVAEAGGEAEFEALMDRQGLEMDWVRHSIRDGVMIDKLVAKIVGRIPAPTEVEIEAFCKGTQAGDEEADRARVADLLLHERRGRAISAYVDLLKGKAVIEDGDEFDGPDIDALFDSYLEGGEAGDGTDVDADGGD